jgi:hypothetical protein
MPPHGKYYFFFYKRSNETLSIEEPSYKSLSDVKSYILEYKLTWYL